MINMLFKGIKKGVQQHKGKIIAIIGGAAVGAVAGKKTSDAQHKPIYKAQLKEQKIIHKASKKKYK